MFKIALVQNISEMRNYSYADLRSDLNELGMETYNFTRENIESLPSVLSADCIDCVIFASNVFNDKGIYAFVTEESFVKLFREYLDQGGACLIMHQHSLKGHEKPFPFIDDSVDVLESNYAEKNVTLKKGSGITDAYFNFPNKISIGDVMSACDKNSAVPGKYWLLMKAAENQWSPIMSDNLGNGVIVRHNSKKVIFSSILLDYQKHINLLHNLLINLLSENRSLAILKNDALETLGFNYFLNSLESKKFFYKEYENNQQGLDDLVTNTSLGVHSAILINHDAFLSLPNIIKETVEKYGVKLIEITDERYEKSDSFTVHSVDKSIALMFSKLELQIQQELANGFISGSFMQTAEILSKLEEFECRGMTTGVYDKNTISNVINRMKSHVKEDGSYDSTFGATCKAFRVFATFLGKDDPLTKATYKYIQNSKDVTTIREKLERFYAISLLENNPKEYLCSACSNIINDEIHSKYVNITEYDFIKLMQVALVIGDEEMLIGLLEYIEDNIGESGELFNSYITSIVSSYLLDMYDLIANEKIKERIRSLLFDLIIYLRKVNISQMSIEESIHTLCALYKFETVVSFPIDDLTEIIYKTGNFPHEYRMSRTQIKVCEKDRINVDAVKNENAKLQEENKALKAYKMISFIMLVALVLFVYIGVYVVLVINDCGVNVVNALFTKIRESWASLFSLAIVPLISLVYKKYIKNKKD